MNTSALIALVPYMILAFGSVLVMLVIPFYRCHRLTVILSLSVLFAAFLSLFLVTGYLPQQATELIRVDGFAFYFMGLILAATASVCLLTYNYMDGRDVKYPEELYLLMLLASLGSSVLAASSHFASLLLGLEILTISLYGLISYLRKEIRCLEAGIKYLILASVSSAFFLFGMALIYADLGTMNLGEITTILNGGKTEASVILLTGLAMMLVGVGFKLALVPFHLWTPDVYQGAAAPITAFIATVSKGGMFAVVLRYFRPADVPNAPILYFSLALIAIVSMLAGNWLALMQNNVKRILAFSSIAHLGYLLVTIIAVNSIAASAGIFYITAYMITTLIAFGIISILSTKETEAEELDDYLGLYWRRPWIAGIFTFALLSLAGIPLTGGFIGKFYIVAAGVRSAEWLIVLVLALSSSIGLFYYLRIIVTMFSNAENTRPAIQANIPLPWASCFALALLTLLLLWMGTVPARLIEWIYSLV